MYFFYFYPVGLDQKLQRPPWLTYGLMLSILVCFLWARYAPYALPLSPVQLVFFPGNGSPLTVLSAIFLHVGWLHVIGNLLYLWVFAPLVEDRLGRARLLHYFLMLGAAGNVVHGLVAVSGLLGDGATGVLGASGAIAGLLAFGLVRFYYARIAVAYWVFTPLQGVNRAGRVYLPLPVAVLLWLLLQVVHGLVARESGAAVSYAAHLGGFGLGLALAFMLGYHRQARAESRRADGRRYLERGQPHAAVGAFLEYLALAPEDLEVRLELARARRLVGQTGQARQDYVHAFRRFVESGQVDRALEVHEEARRGHAHMSLPAAELARAAFFLEKKLDFQGAVTAYLDLYRHFPGAEEAEHALVRAIMLLKTRLRDDREARRWLEVAWRDLEPGVWRDFLAGEFRLDRDADGSPRPSPPDGLWEPAV